MIQKLNIKLDINELREYYHTVVRDFQHLKWTKELEFTNDKWSGDNMVDRLIGWGIDSNLLDINSPSPPYNISVKDKVNYRNTSLAFGIINKLQSIFPYAYRWAISVQEPGGYVNKHNDNSKNLTVWIPIYNPEEAKLVMYYDEETNIHLPSDGSLYLVDTRIDHRTYNHSTEDRVLLSFRFDIEYLNQVLSTPT